MITVNNRNILAAVLTYEVVSIFTPLPTISSLCWRYRALVPVILLGLAVHLLRPPIQGVTNA